MKPSGVVYTPTNQKRIKAVYSSGPGPARRVLATGWQLCQLLFLIAYCSDRINPKGVGLTSQLAAQVDVEGH